MVRVYLLFADVKFWPRLSPCFQEHSQVPAAILLAQHKVRAAQLETEIEQQKQVVKPTNLFSTGIHMVSFVLHFKEEKKNLISCKSLADHLISLFPPDLVKSFRLRHVPTTWLSDFKSLLNVFFHHDAETPLHFNMSLTLEFTKTYKQLNKRKWSSAQESVSLVRVHR